MTSNTPTSRMSRRSVVKGAVAGAVAAGVGTMSAKQVDAQEAYDAVVIGTGFGGSIATLALSAHQKKVLVIERGTFWVTPETLGSPPPSAILPLAKWATANNMRVQSWSRPDQALGLLDLLQNRFHKENPYGLHNYRMFRQAHILTASGVGGGSLIYSNVNMRARDSVLQKIGLKQIDYDRSERFMETYRGKMNAVVTKIPLPPGVASEQLGAKLDPAQDANKLSDKDYLLLDRSRALRDAAAIVAPQVGVAMPWSPLKLSVTEYTHGAGTEADANRTFCERQGRCILGCLPQARHTFNKTLYKFVFSKNTSVSLSPESEARSIRRVGDGYEITYLDRRGQRIDGQEIKVRASQVFLAAGVLGTTELLLRSERLGGIRLSDTLGHGFSTNGDFGALAVGTKHPDGTKMAVYPTRGPINTSDIRFEIDGKSFTVEDCGIPSMFSSIVETGIRDRNSLFSLANPVSFVGGITSSTINSIFVKKVSGPVADPTKDAYATEAERIDNVFFFNAMGEDDADGRFTLNGDQIDLNWDKPIGDHPVFAKIEDILRRLSQAMGGAYTPLPTWEGLAPIFSKKTLIVTHPLGGCRIGPTMAEGVVNEFGQVYDGSKRSADPQAVHPGLYIVDGSVIPGALAANPTLTISAQALKSVERAVGPLPNI